MSTPSAEALLAQADAHVRGGRLADAEACTAQALQLQPRNVRAHFVMGVCCAETGRFEAAVQSYRRALQLQPQSFEALANLGNVYQRMGRFEEAAACYRRAVALRPDEAPVWNGLGFSLAKLGRVADSIAAYQRAVQARPAFPQAWISLGEMLYKVRRDAEATAALDRALALEPDNAAVVFLRNSIAGVQVDHAPREYVASFFDMFSTEFDRKLVDELGYRVPEQAARLLEPWLASREGLRVVDLGCGTGLSGLIVRAKARELVGVDLSRGMLEKAHARGIYDRLEVGEIADFLAACAPASIDLALALDVFIYVGRIDGVFERLAPALAPEGRFVFSMERLEPGQGDLRLARTGRYAHSRDYVERMARQVGLRVLEAEPVVIRKDAGVDVQGDLYILGAR